MADNRADLISQLAASMGAGSFASTKYEESRYDADTGTLFCNGMAISKSVADKAIQHFEILEKKCDQQDSAQRQMAMIYRCAIESIKMMQSEELKEYFANKVKKDGDQ